jgi:hypothetical protein
VILTRQPRSWGHPSAIYTPEGRALPTEQHEEMDRQFDALPDGISGSGEFVTAEALGDPAESTLYGWSHEVTSRRTAVRGGQRAAGRILHHRLRDP